MVSPKDGRRRMRRRAMPKSMQAPKGLTSYSNVPLGSSTQQLHMGRCTRGGQSTVVPAGCDCCSNDEVDLACLRHVLPGQEDEAYSSLNNRAMELKARISPALTIFPSIAARGVGSE